MKQFLILISSAIVCLALLLFFPSPAQAQVANWSGACVETATDFNGNQFEVATIQGLQCLIANVLGSAITIIGLAGFIVFIMSGFRYLLSGGSSKSTQKSRESITFAILGLVISLCGFIILNLLASFTGINSILNFRIPGSGESSEEILQKSAL